MTDDTKRAAQEKAPRSLLRSLLVLVGTSAMLLVLFLPSSMNMVNKLLAGEYIPTSKLIAFTVGSTILIGLQLAAFLSLFICWRRSHREAAEHQ
nr:hypothetical protein [Actinomyces oris]